MKFYGEGIPGIDPAGLAGIRLNGADNAWSETNITLDGAFTVETWVKLDPGIDNSDGILGAPGLLDDLAGRRLDEFDDEPAGRGLAAAGFAHEP